MNNNDHIPVPVIVVDIASKRILNVNAAFKHSVMSCATIENLLLQDIIREADIDLVLKTLATSTDCRCNLLKFSTGNAFPEYVCVHLYSVCHQNNYIICTLLESTLPSQTPLDHQETMIDYLEQAPIGLQWLSGEGRVLWANKTQLQLLGYSAEEFFGKHITEFSTDSEETLTNNFDIISRGKTLHNLSSVWKTKQGECRHVVIDSNMRFGPNGEQLNTRCFIRDDTARQLQNIRAQVEMDSTLASMRSKDKFLRRLLHEIRTPANIMLLSMDESDYEDAKRIRQLQKLIRIIKDVEDADSFQSGKVLVQRKDRFNILDLTYEIFEHIAEEYQSPAVKRSVVLESGWMPMIIEADRHCYKRVLSHLYENALRFTDAGTVSIRIFYDGNVITVAVENTTSNPLDIDSMFRFFNQYWDNDGSEDQIFSNAGIGLGLNVCFNVLQHMGSSLNVKSDNGINSFSFDLTPFVISTTRSDCYTRSIDDIECERPRRRQSYLNQSDWIDIEESKQASTHVLLEPVDAISMSNTCELTAATQTPRRPHILVVDDNILCQKMLSRTLQKLDCTSDLASNGKIACDMVLTQAYDLVFMDLRMAIMDGIEAASFLLQKKATVPIIAFSADSSQAVRDECKRAGMICFLEKPVPASIIKSSIQKYVQFL